ncbi:MAG: hypothetical protein ACFCGT_26315 [Sandaracinaceae bacterium]
MARPRPTDTIPSRPALLGVGTLLLSALAGCGADGGEAAAPPPDRPAALCLGDAHTCVANEAGAVLCWGQNLDGQLGDGTSEDRLEPVAVPIDGPVVDLACGRRHTCAVTEGGAVQCWGSNGDGEVGDGTREPRFVPTPVPGLGEARSVVAGDGFTCALLAEGAVRCWGRGGRLGSGSGRPSPTPVEVRGLSDAAELAAGAAHACARRRGGQVVCWGSDGRGQLGHAAERSEAAPVPVEGVLQAGHVAAGGRTTCAVDADTLRCWGDGGQGQLRTGTGRDADRGTPEAVDGIGVVAEVAIGHAHVCARLASGEVRCWGQASGGRLGGEVGGSAPVRLDGLGDAERLVAGAAHTCAVRASGQLGCWGANGLGQLGPGDNSFDTPRAVIADLAVAVGATSTAPSFPALGDVDAQPMLATGDGFACLLGADGVPRCWGRNGSGQLGDGTTVARIGTPVRPLGLSGVVEIAAGTDHACARRADGTVACWGAHDGGPGTGRQTQTSRPVPVADVDDARGLALGRRFTCILRDGGAVTCFGVGAQGQLGTGSRRRLLVASTPVRGIDEAVEVMAGDDFACARRASPGPEQSSLRCWGRLWGRWASPGVEPTGRAGRPPAPVIDLVAADMPADEAGTPTRPPLRARRAAAGGRDGCAIEATASARCWGASLGVDHGGDPAASGRPETRRRLGRPSEPPIVDLTVGGGTACALSEAGRVTCWGNQAQGQAGHGEGTRVEPGQVTFEAMAEDAGSAGGTPSAAARVGGPDDAASAAEAEAPGGTPSGAARVEGPDDEAVAEPTSSPDIGPVRQVSCGPGYCCALHASGAVSCWGTSPVLATGAPGRPASERSDRPTVLPFTGGAGAGRGRRR